VSPLIQMPIRGQGIAAWVGTNRTTVLLECTGKLELLLRNKKGELHRRPITAGEVKDGLVCCSQSPPEQPLPYYRLASGNSNSYLKLSW